MTHFGRLFDGVVAWGLVFLLAPDAQARGVRALRVDHADRFNAWLVRLSAVLDDIERNKPDWLVRYESSSLPRIH